MSSEFFFEPSSKRRKAFPSETNVYAAPFSQPTHLTIGSSWTGPL
jgi:hypothetical protein